PNPVHLWRALVAWLGGLVTLTAAYVILAPRRLGGFEVEAAGVARGSGHQIQQSVTLGAVTVPLEARLYRALRIILPVYSGLTFALALIFTALGQTGLQSSVHAIAILSTSGISPDISGIGGAESFFVEFFAAIFMIFAASRVLYSSARQGGSARRIKDDPELRLMLILVGLATLMLFSRHWVGALTIDLNEANLDAFDAFWGSFFTTLSFLTTTGFESASWRTARDWSGLANPGLLLLGLCAIGGGAASTAGGIKMIRAYALIRHGMREVERIARPDSVIGVGSDMRGMMRQGAVIAWTFIMLFFIALLLTILGLTATGLSFDTALVAATAAVANTGPLFTSITPDQLGFSDLSTAPQVILALAMIAGRIEVLALIAIFNPDAWRRRGDATIKHW
ncbi:MAG: potassium transporter TrkG, partial [Pseudomonadota bacterium]